MKQEELKARCIALNREIQKLLKDTGYDQAGELCDIDQNGNRDAQGLYEYDALELFIYRIDSAADSMRVFSARKITEGRLHKNERGRYEVNGVELTCGSGIDFMCDDGNHDTWDDDGNIIKSPYWKYSSIESAEKYGGYYLTAAPSIPLEGLYVRVMQYQ